MPPAPARHGQEARAAIELEPWQLDLVRLAPGAFVRGCLHSDGCRFVNRTGPHAYVSYDFANRSADIRGLFRDACHLLGVASREAGDRVRVNRRQSVAVLERHVGPKA